MSMTIADSHIEAPHQLGAGRFAFTFLATALAALIFVPSLALAISYLAGGAATSAILFVYLFAVLTNGPLFGVALALTIGAAVWPAVSYLWHQVHA